MREGLQTNSDGSVTLYFAPKSPKGKGPNRAPANPGERWFTIFRLYGPPEPWFDQTWRPGEVELVS